MKIKNIENAKQLKNWKANKAKDILIELRNELEELQAINNARTLSIIIGKLEAWQNTNVR